MYMLKTDALAKPKPALHACVVWRAPSLHKEHPLCSDPHGEGHMAVGEGEMRGGGVQEREVSLGVGRSEQAGEVTRGQRWRRTLTHTCMITLSSKS